MRRPAAALACLALAACGFQLRGEAPMGLETLHVAADAPSRVATEVRRQLSGTRIRLVDDPARGDARLRILSESEEKSIRTLTSTGRVFDYLLRLRVSFRAADSAGRATIEPTAIEVRRIITYSETAPLAKEAEERLLLEDMRAEAAGQILRRVAVAQPLGGAR